MRESLLPYQMAIDDPVFRLIVVVTLILIGLAVMFAATAVALRIRNDRRHARHVRLEREWLPAIVAVLHGAQDMEQLRDTVAPRDRVFFLDVLYRFARQLRGQELETVRAIAHPFLPAIAEELNRGDAESRARRIQILGLLGFHEYAGRIVEALDDPAPLAAMVAARSLMRREHPEYLRAVLARLHRFENWSYELVASLLYGMGSVVIPDLRPYLADESQPAWVHAVVATALARLNDIASAEIGASLLAHARDPLLVGALLDLVGRTGTREHVEVIRTQLASPREDIRLQAVRALGRIGGMRGDDRLIASLNDPSHLVALSAARELLHIDAKQVLRDLAASDHPRAVLAREVLAEYHNRAA